MIVEVTGRNLGPVVHALTFGLGSVNGTQTLKLAVRDSRNGLLQMIAGENKFPISVPTGAPIVVHSARDVY